MLGAPRGVDRPGVGAVKGEAETPQLTSHNCGDTCPKGNLRRNNVWTDQSFGNTFLWGVEVGFREDCGFPGWLQGGMDLGLD